jgi:glucose-6-phosphate 1-dehydrogenase
VRGQYRGYHDEAGVAPDSTVETFAVVRLAIDTWRWAEVPVYIRAGKCLPVTASEVLVNFRCPPFSPFGENLQSTPNYLRFRLSPEILIALGTRVKRGGETMEGEPVELEVMRYERHALKPYERLLGDAMQGDATLFARQDEVEAAWEVVEPVLGNVTPVHPYDKNSWGPPEAMKITPPGGWYNPPAKEPAPHAAAEPEATQG